MFRPLVLLFALLAISAQVPDCAHAQLAPAHGQLRDLNSHCPLHPPADLTDWQQRAAQLRLQVAASLGVHPPLVLDPVMPNIYGKLAFDGYTIEKVTFESLPGFYVTGNLYKPLNLEDSASVPAVLCPHGHWTEARFMDNTDAEVKQALAIGAERFVSAARNPIQARCVQLARMGCVVFHWDMIGYCDSQQINGQRAHRFSHQSPEAEVTDDGWLLFSAKAEAYGQSVMALQTIATQRAVDMLLSLPFVDERRIAITGASGGGTQSFIGAALDDRISVAFPAVMVSTGMQGGCTCENACLLRTGTGNVEIAALIAPRPLGMTAADDWTRNMAADGFPELKQVYALFGAQDKTQLFPAVHFQHNYNHVSRTNMYGWMNKHLDLGFDSPVLERDFELATKSQLTVWDEAHPRPPAGEDFERGLLKLWGTLVQNQNNRLLRGDQQQLEQLSQQFIDGWRVCLGLTAAKPQDSELTQDTLDSGALSLESDTLETIQLRPVPAREMADNSEFGKLPAADTDHANDLVDTWIPSQKDLHIVLQPNHARSQEDQVAWYPQLSGEATIDKLDDEGEYIVFRTAQQRLVANPRLAAAYTFGYNTPLFAQRAQQLGTILHWLHSQYPEQSVTLSAESADAALAAAGVFCYQQTYASKQSESPLSIHLELDFGDFRFEEVDHIRGPDFTPGAAKYGDVGGLLASLHHVALSLADSSEFQAYRRLHRFNNNQLEQE